MLILTILRILQAEAYLPDDGWLTSRGTLNPFGGLELNLKTDRVPSDGREKLISRNGMTSMPWTPGCMGAAPRYCSPYILDMYADRITIEFNYVNNTGLDIQSPVIGVRGGRARPVIEEFRHERSELSGEITIWHNCRRTESDTSEDSNVRLLFHIAHGKTLDIAWVKQCGFGSHMKLDYGYYALFDNDNQEMKSLLEHLSLNQVVTFTPAVLSTRMYLKLTNGGHSQKFRRPTLTVTRQNAPRNVKPLVVELRGAMRGGVIMGLEESNFDVLYTCYGVGRWVVKAEIVIDPFEEIVMQWQKDCGGGVEPFIDVGSVRKSMLRTGSWDVVHKGKTSVNYRKGFHWKKVGGWEKKVRWHGTGNKIFFLQVGNEEGGYEGGIHIGELVASSNNDHVGTAWIAGKDEGYGRLMRAGKVLGPTGERIYGYGKRIIRVKVECMRRGRIGIAVRMSIHDRESVEWWFENECRGRGVKQSWYPTAGSLMYTTLVLLFGAMGMWLRRGMLADQRVVIIHSRYKGARRGSRFSEIRA